MNIGELILCYSSVPDALTDDGWMKKRLKWHETPKKPAHHGLEPDKGNMSPSPRTSAVGRESCKGEKSEGYQGTRRAA